MDEKTIARFWSKVNRGGHVARPELGNCWEWVAYRDRMGYGQVGVSKPRRLEYAHRFAWILEHGDTGGLCVLHKCDNPACVRPAHMFLGDRTENMADKVRKGRQLRGASTPRAVLSESIVRDIRSLRFADGMTTRAIANDLGLNENTVKGVVGGYNWRHVK